MKKWNEVEKFLPQLKYQMDKQVNDMERVGFDIHLPLPFIIQENGLQNKNGGIYDSLYFNGWVY